MRDHPPATESVTSQDGTRIGYLRQGSGSSIVLAQGAMADVHAYRDLDAILGATGATDLFGLSSGAVITLEAARTLHCVKRALVYEPPFYEHGVDRTGIARLHADIERDDFASALLDSLLAAGTAPWFLRKAPRPVARALARIALAADSRKRGPAVTLPELLPGVRYDFHDVASVDGNIATYAAITKPILLLSGTKSPAFLRHAIRTLHRLMPQSRHHEFDGLGHDGPWNGGDPTAIASVVRAFLQKTA